jgi:hypothetical protein
MLFKPLYLELDFIENDILMLSPKQRLGISRKRVRRIILFFIN